MIVLTRAKCNWRGKTKRSVATEEGGRGGKRSKDLQNRGLRGRELSKMDLTWGQKAFGNEEEEKREEAFNLSLEEDRPACADQLLVLSAGAFYRRLTQKRGLSERGKGQAHESLWRCRVSKCVNSGLIGMFEGKIAGIRAGESEAGASPTPTKDA